MSEPITVSQAKELDAAFRARVKKNLAPSELREDGTRKDGALAHPEGCGCVDCNFERYGCEACGLSAEDGACTAAKCQDDADVEPEPETDPVAPVRATQPG